MALIKSTKFMLPFNLNYRVITEYSNQISEKVFVIIVKGFMSEEQRLSDGILSSYDGKAFSFDTEKKFKSVEEQKEIEIIEGDLVQPETYNEDGTIKDEAVYNNLRPVKRTVGTGVFNNVWENEDRYIEIPENGVTTERCYEIIKKTKEFAGSDDAK